MVPDVQLWHGHDHVVRDQPLRIPVVRSKQDPAACGPHRCVSAVITDDRSLAEGVRRTDSDGIVHLDAHALERLVEVDPVARGVEHPACLDASAGIVLDHLIRWDSSAGADHDRSRQRVPA